MVNDSVTTSGFENDRLARFYFRYGTTATTTPLLAHGRHETSSTRGDGYLRAINGTSTMSEVGKRFNTLAEAKEVITRELLNAGLSY